jgi:hypothetical protein
MCNNYNRAFFINLHCHSKCVKKWGGVWGPPPENFYFFEAPGLHISRFLKQIRNRIGSKLTVLYKSLLLFHKNNDFITKWLVTSKVAASNLNENFSNVTRTQSSCQKSKS